MIEIIVWWNVIGLIGIMALHQVSSWPSSAWFGWMCMFIAGPLTWFVYFLLWVDGEARARKDRKNDHNRW